MTKKVLFFDIDGTLVDKARGVPEIPEGVVRELKRLQASGHKLFISSGRPKAMMNEDFLNKGFDGFILANGGHVEVDGVSIYENRMDYELAKKTADMLEDLNCEYMICTADKIYIHKDYEILYNFFSVGGMGHLFEREYDRDEVLKHALKIEANVTNEDKARIENYVQNDFGYVIVCDTHGSENCFELYSPTISKATGIQKILDYFDLDVIDSYAFGDGMNDIEMLTYCGCGVAMGNALPEVKAVADIVCGSIENSGLEEILKQLFK